MIDDIKKSCDKNILLSYIDKGDFKNIFKMINNKSPELPEIVYFPENIDELSCLKSFLDKNKTKYSFFSKNTLKYNLNEKTVIDIQKINKILSINESFSQVEFGLPKILLENQLNKRKLTLGNNDYEDILIENNNFILKLKHFNKNIYKNSGYLFNSFEEISNNVNFIYKTHSFTIYDNFYTFLLLNNIDIIKFNKIINLISKKVLISINYDDGFEFEQLNYFKINDNWKKNLNNLNFNESIIFNNSGIVVKNQFYCDIDKYFDIYKEIKDKYFEKLLFFTSLKFNLTKKVKISLTFVYFYKENLEKFQLIYDNLISDIIKKGGDFAI